MEKQDGRSPHPDVDTSIHTKNVQCSPTWPFSPHKDSSDDKELAQCNVYKERKKYIFANEAGQNGQHFPRRIHTGRAWHPLLPRQDTVVLLLSLILPFLLAGPASSLLRLVDSPAPPECLGSTEETESPAEELEVGLEEASVDLVLGRSSNPVKIPELLW